MPRKVSSLPLEQNKNTVNNHQVVVTDPTNFSLYRVPVSEFRGASLFTSTIAPTETPEDITIPAYHANDVFLQRTAEGEFIYKRNNTNSGWELKSKLNGMRVLTSDDFDPSLNLDDRTTNYLDNAKIFEGDYYLNRKYNILFGPYSSVLGFHFENNNFEGYQAFRAPTTFTLQGDDVRGYDNPAVYIDEFLNDPLQSAEDKYRLAKPIHGDNIRLLIENDEGHEGYWYEFDSTIPTVAGDFTTAYLTKLGTDGILTNVKRNWREPKVWNDTVPPLQNNKKYIGGDIVFDMTAGVMYYNYDENAPDLTTDLGLLFEGQTVLKSEGLKISVDGTGAWVPPVKNDSIYVKGDLIVARDSGTPRIHGPYVFGAATDSEAWPIYAVMRHPVDHTFEFDIADQTGFNLPTSYTSEFPISASGVMIVDGDRALLNYSANKAYFLRDTVTVDAANKTINWGDTTKRINMHPVTISVSAAVGEPSIDVTQYYNGAIVRNQNNDLFEFVEVFDDHASSFFQIIEGLRPTVTHIVEELTGQYIPPTTNGHADWGSGLVIDGDELEVRTLFSDTNKVVVFTAQVNEVTGDIEWRDRRSRYGIRTFAGWEAWDDSNLLLVGGDHRVLFTEGDIIVTDKGTSYVYREDYDNAFGSVKIEFTGWVRGNITLPASGNTLPTDADIIPITGAFQDYCISFNGDVTVGVAPKSGDKIRFEFTEIDGITRTGKVLERVCIAERPPVFGDWYNPKPTKIWAEVSPTRNNRNDSKYSSGDFMDNPSTEWRYGPYVEGATTNEEAWPDFTKLTQTEQYVDATTSNIFEIQIDDNQYFFVEK